MEKHIEHLKGNGRLETIDGAPFARVQYLIDIWEEIIALPGGEKLEGQRDVRGSVRGPHGSRLENLPDQDLMLFLDDHRRKILIRIDGVSIIPRGGLTEQ